MIDDIPCSIDLRYWRCLSDKEFEKALVFNKNSVREESYICKRCEDVIYHPIAGNTCFTCDAPKDNLEDVIKCGIGRAILEVGI